MPSAVLCDTRASRLSSSIPEVVQRHPNCLPCSHALSPRLQHRLKKLAPSPTGIQSLAAWGACAGVTALWLTQPFDLIKKTLGMGEEPAK